MERGHGHARQPNGEYLRYSQFPHFRYLRLNYRISRSVSHYFRAFYFNPFLKLLTEQAWVRLSAFFSHCCGSGSCAFLTLGSGMGKKSRSGSGIRTRGWTSRIPYFLELGNNFWVKILKSLMRIRNPGIFLTLDPGSGNVPDPQHCFFNCLSYISTVPVLFGLGTQISLEVKIFCS